jgi:hypothetical protein
MKVARSRNSEQHPDLLKQVEAIGHFSVEPGQPEIKRREGAWPIAKRGTHGVCGVAQVQIKRPARA